MNPNEMIPFTRRYPILPLKQLERDAKIARKIIAAWDDMHDERTVFSLFQKYRLSLSAPRYWEILKQVCIICGSLGNANVFRQWMMSRRPYRHYFMTPEELTFLNGIKFPCNVFRACNGEDNGLSYTLSENYAKKYQADFGKQTMIIRSVERNNVFAYVNRNGEDEIIIL